MVLVGMIYARQASFPGFHLVANIAAATATYLGGGVWHAECAGTYNIGFGFPRRISLRLTASALSIPPSPPPGGFGASVGASMRLKAVAAATGDPCEIDAATGGWWALTEGHNVRSCSPLDLVLAARNAGFPSASPTYNPYYAGLVVTE